MKIALAFLVGCLAILTVFAAPDYTTKYDNIDLDKILGSERLLKNYHNCLMDRGNCSPEGRELKEVLPDALANDCSGCNGKQKDGAEKVIRFLAKNKPEMWAELTMKYDPEGKHKDSYPVADKEEAEKPTP